MFRIHLFNLLLLTLDVVSYLDFINCFVIVLQYQEDIQQIPLEEESSHNKCRVLEGDAIGGRQAVT